MSDETREPPTRTPADAVEHPPSLEAPEGFEITNIKRNQNSYDVSWKCPDNRHPKAEGDWIGIYKNKPDYDNADDFIAYLYITTKKHEGTMSVLLDAEKYTDKTYVAYVMWKWQPVAFAQVKDFS